jgi:hypothetical protein
MENNTFNITLDSCENCPKVVATFENVPEEKLSDVLYYATRAFRSIEVINNQTGEIAFNSYTCVELFKDKQNYNYGEALDYMHHIITR